jgi:exodeoxyribonuclease V alpha subunit
MQILKGYDATEEQQRIFHLATHVMSKGGGHTWYPRMEIARDVNGDTNLIEKAIAHNLVTVPTGGKLALSYIHKAECDVARMVIERLDQGVSVQDDKPNDLDSKYTLNEQQDLAVKMAIRAPISVWTGPPGSGKTTALSALAKRMSSPEHILFLAPTGKAVVRLREVTCETQTTQPMTVHRWIHTSEHHDGYKMVVVDEASMLDILTFRDLLSKVDTDTHVVLVGDTDQLSSVGHGCVLRDLIEAGVPCVQLSTVYRQQQGSHLAEAIEALRADPMCIPESGPIGSDFWIENITNRVALGTRLCALVKEYMSSGVIVATFRNQDVDTFGKLIRPCRRAQPWKLSLLRGDKVMQTHNVYNKTNGTERLNGETGTIIGIIFGEDDDDNICTRRVRVQFDVDKRIEVYRDDLYGTQETYEELTMAVPITVHKAQGSQAETLIYVIPSENMFETKNLVYTAISRAQKRCIVLGSRAAFIVAINRQAEHRRTMLAEYIVRRYVPKL